ncbi:hypothetical protein MTO96_017878 [Rhipicephalus appendiculatus]
MSSSSSLDATECAVFGVLTALGYLVGIYFSIARRRKQITSSENERVAAELEAFLGGRRLPGIALAVSVLASAVNGMNIVAVAGHYYAYGFHLMWTVVWIPVVGAFVASTLVPLLYGLRVSTVFQYPPALLCRTDFVVTTDENVWTTLVACVPYSLVRIGCDQMSVQRFMAAKTAREARWIPIAGAAMLLLFFGAMAFAALAVVYWYRDCDPPAVWCHLKL